MNLEEFWEGAAQGVHHFAWVNLNDMRVCPDCMAIALQQPAEGATWDDWVSFGMPGAGHTVCQGDCRCRMAPLMYVQTSTEFMPGRGGLIISDTGPTEAQRRIIVMVDALEAAGMDLAELDLIGLNEKGMEVYLEERLHMGGVDLPDVA